MSPEAGESLRVAATRRLAGRVVPIVLIFSPAYHAHDGYSYIGTIQDTEGPVMVVVKHGSRAASRTAFTLLEVLIVVAILVILAGVGGVQLIKYLDEAKKDRARIDVKQLSSVVKTYEVKHGGPPASLDVLAQRDQDGGASYLETTDALIDPWGQHYQYDPNTGRVFTVCPKDGAVIDSTAR
jgi:general secretion pathway protein G